MRELLELAAKACGYTPVPGFWPYTEVHGLKIECEEDGDYLWAPHANDGDCARMEAELGISVRWYAEYVVADVSGQPILDSEEFSAFDGNKQAARRRAVLKVAAEIGKHLAFKGQN